MDEFNLTLEEYAFGIRPGPGFNYCQHERQIIKTITDRYSIDEWDVYTLIDFVKTELSSIRHKELSNTEIRDIRKFIESGNSITSVSFVAPNNKKGKQGFKIKDKELIEVLLKYVTKRYHFAEIGGDKNFVKLIFKVLFDRLTKYHKIEPLRADEIIGYIFGLYGIALINNPIQSVFEYGETGYEAYLRQNMVSFHNIIE
jgi:hypothetical protein